MRGIPLKDVILPLLALIVWKRLQIGTDLLRHWWRFVFRFVNIDYPERPWTLQKEGFGEFFAIFGCSAHFNSKLRRNGWR